MASKGKAIADGKGKRKRDDSDKTGRKKAGALKFIEDSGYEFDESDSSFDDSLFGDGDDDFLEDEVDTQVNVKSEPCKAGHFPVIPKEEEMTEEELDKMLEERYKPGSSFVTFAEDRFKAKRFTDGEVMSSRREPIIWKVKCMIGRERHSAFCLMQKYVDLQSLGTKLQIISAFSLEHIKGALYIEADKQSHIAEACSGICSIYPTRLAPVPQNEMSTLLNVRSKSKDIAVGSWARVKNGKYKGDLAQVVAVNENRKKATVKLIPRIDLQALAEKFGGGVTSKKTTSPTPRLICSSELEEFRPLIQMRRDRDSDMFFEILDGMMLKDGYLYKKVPIDSLSFWGVLPSEDELLKFEPSKKEESADVEWLSQLYGEQEKKCTRKSDKGGGKGECSSSSNLENEFEVHDMVFFSRTGFGVIIGREKDDSFKILNGSSGGQAIVNVKLRELKKTSFDKKFTTWDRHRKTISINDTLRILEGPLEGREGIVKQIYRGTVFLYNEVEQENGGYFCSKAQNCEKIKLSSHACKGKGGESGPSGIDDFPPSPKSPLSPKKPWQEKDNNSNFNQGDQDGMFSVGQSLRIRVGPLKGYLCRVLALKRSDVTVKLDSQHKILTVKPEHLAAVREKILVAPMGDDPESAKPFDLLGTQDGSGGWMNGAGTSAGTGGWGTESQSTERSSWPALPSSSFSLQPESDPLNSMDIDSKKDAGDSAWETKVPSTQNSSWGAATADKQVGGDWNNASSNTVAGSSASDGWGVKASDGDPPGSSNDDRNWGSTKLKIASTLDSNDAAAPSWGKKNDANNSMEDGWKKSEGAWDKGTNNAGDSTSSWGNASEKNKVDSWAKGKDDSSGSKSIWNTTATTSEKETGGWGDASRGGYNTGGDGRGGGRGGGIGGYGGRNGGGGNACYKCGESGHMARECSQGGGGGNACYKCGETGHMARECTQGGGGSGSGSACYKCGETGHMARECSQGGGNACFKCGETGHMARECSQGGGGGNACYMCGATGHMARECSQGGGSGERYGKSSWSASFSSKEKELNKDGGETTWGNSNSGWNKTSDTTGFGNTTSDGWGGAKSSSGKQPGSSIDAGASWGKNNDATNNQAGGWKKSDESWGKGNATVNTTSSWGNAGANNPVDSWTKGKAGEDGFNGSKGGWSSSTATLDKETGSWGNASAGGRGGSRGGGRGGYTVRGSSGGNACYKCGETGHMARECNQGGGGAGNACHKCGETGHMARECSKGGGNACYKCGETGHMARECSQSRGGNSKSTWSFSSLLPQPESSSADPLKSTGDVSKKDGQDTAWPTKAVQDHNSSWGSTAMSNEKTLFYSAEVKEISSGSDAWENATNKWGGKESSSGNAAVWSTSEATKKNEVWGGCNDTTPSWGKNNDSVTNQDGSGWKTSNEASGNNTSGWSHPSGKESGGWSSSVSVGGSGGSQGGYGGRSSGGNTCFKCGEAGHMARDCSQGGRSGGNGCYKCGEQGHFARECPNSNS